MRSPLLARVLVATRLSLVLALAATVVGAAIGIPWGALPVVLGRRAARRACGHSSRVPRHGQFLGARDCALALSGP